MIRAERSTGGGSSARARSSYADHAGAAGPPHYCRCIAKLVSADLNSLCRDTHTCSFSCTHTPTHTNCHACTYTHRHILTHAHTQIDTVCSMKPYVRYCCLLAGESVWCVRSRFNGQHCSCTNACVPDIGASHFNNGKARCEMHWIFERTVWNG